MAGRIRVLDSANKTMQRLGYLKALCSLVTETETSNLATLGKRLIERVTKRVRIEPPLAEQLRDYVGKRLTDGAYRSLRKSVLQGSETPISLEIQDLYLADSSMPSRTGKLVKANWRRYPYLGTSIDLVKKGTYSALTRALVLLAVTPKEELHAFLEFDRHHNPLRISDAQALVLLYCLADNDADVLLPLFKGLTKRPSETFDERVASEMLPDILRQIIRDSNRRSLTAEERDRIAMLAKVASSINQWKGKPHTGGGAREEAIRVRIEPFCDLGFLKKPDPDFYEYCPTRALETLVMRWESFENTDRFLENGYFRTFAACRGIPVGEADDAEATQALVEAGETLRSSLGYSPITDVGLLAGTRLLIKNHRVLELHRTVELLKELQKRDPNFVRFTVDRMGLLAHVKFLKSYSVGSL